ncbi:GNAT family N-acetyltransferase [Yoonia sp. GPGPB17]|uniref:GNAT family N-acetyltransferase n=1 Tax=Yoonia sp. GPGPB17 TaxID=3026147 RepID=UPI0030C1D1E9
MMIRDAMAEDATEMSVLLRELTAARKRTSPDTEAHVLSYYINDPVRIICSVAEHEDVILGFQSLRMATSGNQWGVEPGWGIVGTHIRPSAARRGAGRALFDVTKKAARDAGLIHIDAAIAATNPEGLGYYEAMGFKTYRKPEGLICKRFDV